MHMAKLTGTSSNNTLTGTNTADEITGRLGDDVINGNAGNDILYGDMIVGEEKGIDIETLDYYSNHSGNDIIHGGDGNDTIYDRYEKNLSSTHNILYGDDGNDKITGSGILNGGRGDDIIFIWDGEVIGGKGNDTISGSVENQSRLFSGNDGNDFIAGSGTLNGGSGDDILTAWESSTLHGGIGNDTLGGVGNNILWGNQGNDTFEIGEDTTKVYIKDFMKGQDHIDLSDLNLNKTPEILEHTTYYVKLDIPNHDMDIYVHVMKDQTLTSSDFIF
jgi:Ca2+-binding RTX toxin-like protein